MQPKQRTFDSTAEYEAVPDEGIIEQKSSLYWRILWTKLVNEHRHLTHP